MIPIPSYQVVQFLDWLKSNGLERKMEAPSQSELRQLAFSFLERRQFQQERQSQFGLVHCLRLFQTCRYVRSQPVLAQMEHFAECHTCFSGRESDAEAIDDIILHPLLLGFLDYCEISGFLEAFESSTKNAPKYSGDTLPSPFWRDNSIGPIVASNGRKLLFEFRRFLHRTDPEQILAYERYLQDRTVESPRSRRGRDDDRGRTGAEEPATPIQPDEDLRQAANRLVATLEQVLQGKLYPGIIISRPQYAHLATVLGGNSEELALYLRFLSWMTNKYPEVNISGDIPSDKLADMVYDFSEEIQYNYPKKLYNQIQEIFVSSENSSIISRLVSVQPRRSGWPSLVGFCKLAA